MHNRRLSLSGSDYTFAALRADRLSHCDIGRDDSFVMKTVGKQTSKDVRFDGSQDSNPRRDWFEKVVSSTGGVSRLGTPVETLDGAKS